ncbi:MAG: tyrosine--tRNA ligase [Candidatus Babeliales bacterium]
MTDYEKQFQTLKAGTAQVVPETEFLKKLKKGKKLRIKLGMDPTAPDLHLGHAVVLSKMREFQDLGHEVIFLIGDFTARIGDPTGKSKTRPPLTEEEIARNTATYFEQVSRILDPKKVSIRFNAEWLDKLSAKDIINITSKITVAQLIEREDFANRIKKHEPISFHELLYPLCQAYDSVELKADVELGGTDQTFNLLMGRDLQERFGQEGQVIMTLPILEGLDGVQKMSKSLGNYVGLAEQASQAFGKLMSMPDSIMWRYLKLLLAMPDAEVSRLQEQVAAGTTHPMALKKKMAHDIIAKFWSPDQAVEAERQFEAVFQQRDYSKATEFVMPADSPNPIWIIELMKLLGTIDSSSQGRRLVQEGAVKIDEKKVADVQEKIHWRTGMQVKIGKHHIFKLM